MTNKERLVLAIDKARSKDHSFFAIATFAEGMKKPETIIFDKEDFDFKQDYLINAYDDELKLKRGPVHIVGMSSGNQACALLNNMLRGTNQHGKV